MIETNINYFLKDKSSAMNFSLENAKDDFKIFWNKINAEGDLESALAEWDTTYNGTTK